MKGLCTGAYILNEAHIVAFEIDSHNGICDIVAVMTDGSKLSIYEDVDSDDVQQLFDNLYRQVSE